MSIVPRLSVYWYQMRCLLRRSPAHASRDRRLAARVGVPVAVEPVSISALSEAVVRTFLGTSPACSRLPLHCHVMCSTGTSDHHQIYNVLNGVQ